MQNYRRYGSIDFEPLRVHVGAEFISPVLRQLHWLPVRQRVAFKDATLVHQALSRHAPTSWHGTAASSPTLVQEDCARLRLERFLSVGGGPTSATEASMQLDLESGTIRRWISDSQTCHHSRFRQSNKTFYLVSGTKEQCKSPFNGDLEILLPTYLAFFTLP